MPFPEPVPGLVIRYSYLWAEEYRRGLEEGAKDRPCAVILVSTEENGERLVTVLPITHAPPSDPDLAVELREKPNAVWGLMTPAPGRCCPRPTVSSGPDLT